MTLTGVCHCPRQIISNTARCIPILLPPQRLSPPLCAAVSSTSWKRELAQRQPCTCVYLHTCVRVCRVSVCSPVRVVHARNRFAAPRRFALPTFFFGPIDRRVFPLYSRSKGIGRRCSSGWQDFSLLVENRYSKFAINELFDCCSIFYLRRIL